MQQGHLHPGTLSIGFGSLRQDLNTPYSGSETIPNPEGRRTLQDGLVLTADYGLAERVNLGILIPYRRSESRGRVEADVEGLGDIGLSARFALTDPHGAPLRVNALTLISLPTGRVETGFLDENIVLGVGAIALGAGFEVIRDSPSGASAFLRALGSKPTGPSDEGVRFGGSLASSAGYGRPLVSRGRVRWAVSGTVSWTEADREGDLPVPNRGGRLVTLSAGLAFPLGGGPQLSLGTERLLSADLRGDQLASRWSGFVAVRWTRAVKR
jgi:hypothetical protein